MADEARKKGIEVECCFFGADSAQEIAAKDGRYSLVIGNNVLAHVPDINSFVEGLAIVLAAEGTITMEFPHLLRLIEQCQFDTIYHEHFHYLSTRVEELPTHGGSLRIYAAHQEYGQVHMRSTARALGQARKPAALSSDTYVLSFCQNPGKSHPLLPQARRFPVHYLSRSAYRPAARRPVSAAESWTVP